MLKVNRIHLRKGYYLECQTKKGDMFEYLFSGLETKALEGLVDTVVTFKPYSVNSLHVVSEGSGETYKVWDHPVQILSRMPIKIRDFSTKIEEEPLTKQLTLESQVVPEPEKISFIETIEHTLGIQKKDWDVLNKYGIVAERLIKCFLNMIIKIEEYYIKENDINIDLNPIIYIYKFKLLKDKRIKFTQKKLFTPPIPQEIDPYLIVKALADIDKEKLLIKPFFTYMEMVDELSNRTGYSPFTINEYIERFINKKIILTGGIDVLTIHSGRLNKLLTKMEAKREEKRKEEEAKKKKEKPKKPKSKKLPTEDYDYLKKEINECISPGRCFNLKKLVQRSKLPKPQKEELMKLADKKIEENKKRLKEKKAKKKSKTSKEKISKLEKKVTEIEALKDPEERIKEAEKWEAIFQEEFRQKYNLGKDSINFGIQKTFAIIRKNARREIIRTKAKIIDSLIGKRFTDSKGIEWELVGRNDLNVPYFSKVVKGRVQKKQFTHEEGECLVNQWISEELKKQSKSRYINDEPLPRGTPPYYGPLTPTERRRQDEYEREKRREERDEQSKKKKKERDDRRKEEKRKKDERRRHEADRKRREKSKK